MTTLSAQLPLHCEPPPEPSEPPKTPLPVPAPCQAQRWTQASAPTAWHGHRAYPALTPDISLGRWIKFEEKVEDGGERWSAPHVPALPLHSLFQLRTYLQTGTVLLDLDATSFKEIIGTWVMQRSSLGTGWSPERDRPPGGAYRTALTNDSWVPGESPAVPAK